MSATEAAYPDNNPKTVFGVKKPAFHFTPPVAELVLGQAMANGGAKYGLMNWRGKSISSSVYYDAARRHLAAWWDGEDIDRESGVHHLGHAMACCALVLDGADVGKLNDDRPVKGGFSARVACIVADADQAARAKVEGVDAGEAQRFKVGEQIRCNCGFGCVVRGPITEVFPSGYRVEQNRSVVFVRNENAERVQ